MSPPAAATRASFVLANPLMDSNNFAHPGLKRKSLCGAWFVPVGSARASSSDQGFLLSGA